jgi:hypothetical protein
MRRMCAIGLTLTLCVQPLLAAAADSPGLSGPIGRAVALEASRLAAESLGQPAQTETQAPPGWRGVPAIQPGRSIVINTSTATLRRTFLASDTRTVTVLNLTPPELTDAARQRLRDLAEKEPGLLIDAAGGSPLTVGPLRFGADGVFLDDVKVAELQELIERLPAGDLLTIALQVRRGSAAAASLAAIGGLYLGALLGFTVTSGVNCYRGCAGAQAATLGLMVAVPIAVGYGAWHASSRLVEELVYVRQAAQP